MWGTVTPNRPPGGPGPRTERMTTCRRRRSTSRGTSPGGSPGTCWVRRSGWPWRCSCYGLLNSAVTGLPGWVVVVVAVAAAVGLGLVPGARELEVTAARALLDVDGELVAPAEPRFAHRVRTAAWVVTHLVTGMFVGACLFAVSRGRYWSPSRRWRGARSGPSSRCPRGPRGDRAAGGLRRRRAAGARRDLAAGRGRVRARGPRARPHAVRPDGDGARPRSREAEHTRLARELHDGIGHALTVVSVQAAAGRRVVAANPGAAADALAAIEETARSALAELDQLLAVLRDDDVDRDAARPAPRARAGRRRLRAPPRRAWT